jgi:uncharacterized membrane protein YoaK (UPF0700 family)
MYTPYLLNLSHEKRDQRSDRHLGYVLAVVAGAVNAGGFVAIGFYTSHMTGIVSSMSRDLALGNFKLVLTALSAWLAFLAGAAISETLISLARRRRVKLGSQYALPLLLESGLLLLFGLAGSHMEDMPSVIAPITVLLLCFIMGLQNAIITTMSGAAIRTTHITGMSTDIGIELGKLFYYNRERGKRTATIVVRANHAKLILHAKLVGCFFLGGIGGVLGFKYIGFSATVILAVTVAILAIGPILYDMRLIARYYRPKV